MQTLQPHWSQTSARLLNECPRAWALTYRPNLPSAPFTNHAPTYSQTRPRTFDEALVQATRTTWLERINDQFLAKVWSTKFAKQRLKANLKQTMEDCSMKVPHAHETIGSMGALNQLRALERTIALHPLFSGQPRRWSYFDRRLPANLNSLQLYAAPDVAIFHQNKWTLIRLQFRSGSQAGIQHQLEHLLMVHWAMRQPGFPDDMNAYRVRVVRWRHRSWIEHNVVITQQHLDQALALVHHDVQEMKWIWRSATSDSSLATVALANNERACKRCRWRPSCPAVHGLQRAKEEQARYLETLTHNEATKSASTA